MRIEYVVYGAFRDTIDSRAYFDIVIAHEGVAIIPIGSLPSVPKHRSSLPRVAELQLLRLAKERYRRRYTHRELLTLIRNGKAIFIPQEEIACCTLRERAIPIPPILRRPPSNPREKPRYEEVVLEITIFTTRSVERFYTTTRIKEELKRSLKAVGMYVPRSDLSW